MSIMNRMNATTTVETAAVVVARVVEAVAAVVAEAHVEEARVNTFINTTSLVCRQTSEVDLHPPLTRHIVQACPRKPAPVPGPCSPT
jgi:hypothetical protein